MIVKGFKFGILLQLSIGPVCIFVFNSAGSYGFLTGLVVVFGVALVDAVYISLAGTGVVSILKHDNIRWIIKLLGFFVLIFFGIDTILNAFNRPIFPDINLFSVSNTSNIFLKVIMMTGSNPLTILFWSGVFSTEAINRKMNKHQIYYFGLGCVLATVVFLTGVTILGCTLHNFLPKTLIIGLNAIVGFVLIIFGIKLLFKKS